MKVLVNIARNELRNLFYSPVAWMLLIVFTVMCAFFYTGILYPWVKQTFVTYKNYPQFQYWATDSITRAIYSNLNGGFLTNVLSNLYLFVPLLTMGIMSREFNNGTIKLLYSSPVKLRQIVLGKYLALMIFNLLFILIISIFIVSGFFDIKSLDYPTLLSASLGIYLLLSALAAIGFFMSSLTTYAIVSAVACFTLLFILNRIGGWWQQYDVVRDLSYFLSISGRTEKMLIGLITTKDIVYYLVIIFMFVSFTLIRLRADRESKSWYTKAGRYLAVLAVGLFIGYVSSRPRFTGYLDTTAGKVNTIHPRTQKIIEELGDSTLEVTLYTNLLGAGAELGFPRSRNAYLSELWEPYQRFKKNINFKYKYYYDANGNDTALYRKFPGKSLKQIAELFARRVRVDSSIFEAPEDIRKSVDLGSEGRQLVMQLKYRGRTAFLRTFSSDPGFWPDEQNVNAALKRLLGADMPKVYFVSGDLERNIYKRGEREYFTHTINKERHGSLINIGFDTDTLNLATQDIPADATNMVMADPKMDLNQAALTKLRSYIERGGNMLVFGEPGKQYVLNPLLKSLGVELMNGQLVQPTYNETPDNVSFYFNLTGFSLAEETWLLKFKYVWDHQAFRDSLKITMPGVAGIDKIGDSGFVIKPFLMTLPDRVWLKTGNLVTDSAAPVFSIHDGDRKAVSFAVAAQLTRQIKGKEQRIIISGDADFASNSRIIDDLTRALYSWLSYNEFPVYTPVPYAKDNRVVLSPVGASIEKIIYVWILPGLLLVLASVSLIRRKRK